MTAVGANDEFKKKKMRCKTKHETAVRRGIINKTKVTRIKTKKSLIFGTWYITPGMSYFDTTVQWIPSPKKK